MARRNGRLESVSWDEALQLFVQKINETRTRGAANAVFINQHESGSFPGFLDAWLAGFGMPAHLSYDAGADHAAIAANRQSYGVSWPKFDFRAARLIVSIGADFLDGWGAMVPQQLDFADARADNAKRAGPERVARAAHVLLHGQVENGTQCPLTMTFASFPVLARAASTHRTWSVCAPPSARP